MPILVTTGGPMSDTGSLLGADMRNFNDMVRAIADELDDDHGEYTEHIHRAIFAALRTLAREPFYFNQARDIVFDTVAGQAWYGVTDHEHIGSLAGLVAVFCQRGAAGPVWKLQRETAQKLEILDAATPAGQPRQFCYFGQKLRLFPRPDNGPYRIRLQIAPKRFDQIKDGQEDHIWFIEAFDLIFARAKYTLYKDILKDSVAAAAALADFHEQMHLLRAETSRRLGNGCIKATLF